MKIVLSLATISSFLFWACSNKRPLEADIVGMWVSSEMAEFIFNKDGTFIGKSIPTIFGFFPSDAVKNPKFSGTGKWILRKGDVQWEVYLDFQNVNIDKNGCSFSLMVGGEKGILDNKPPWYLFVWKGEEGGDIYQFTKKQ